MSERLIMPQLSEFDKGRCVGYLEAGKSIRWTALTLNVSKSTVERWWNRYRREGHVRRREGSGRPRLTSPAQDRKLVVNIKRNRFSPVSRLSREWACACSIIISMRTATRRAVMAGLLCVDLLSGFRRLQVTNVVGSSGAFIISGGVQNGIVLCGQTKADFA